MRWLVLLVVTGCSFGNGSPSMSPVMSGDPSLLVTSEALDRQNPAADTRNNKVLLRSEASGDSDSALRFPIELAAAIFQEALGHDHHH